ncbi:hypothetical protein RNJ44_04608 [Nakaseomyces bracarensis]|uniref:DUF1746 domain-containing protein n=1 Tax=Nakaseomyces bracarensis TaxID=273131 RepID=A0ABR4NVE7_9SACH
MGIVATPLEVDNETKGRAVMDQIQMVCYVVIYIRFVRDRSMFNVFLVLLCLLLSGFLNSLLVSYLRKQLRTMEEADPNEEEEILQTEVIRNILVKSIRYFQGLLLMQCMFCIMYHGFKGSALFRYINDDSDEQEPPYYFRYGYFIMNLIGEETPYMKSRWKLLLIDLGVLILQLAAITRCLEPELDNIKLIIPELRTFDRGITSILRLNTFKTTTREEVITLCTCQAPDQCHHSEETTDYGSI